MKNRINNNYLTPTRQLRLSASAAAITSVFMACSGAAMAATVTLDGIMDSNDTYDTTTSVLWFNDHEGTQFSSGASPLQTTTVKYGTGTLAGGVDEYFFLFIEAPLAAKNLVWGTGASDAEIALYNQQYSTHHSPLSNDPGSKDYFDYEKATGSEKLVFNGITADPNGKEKKVKKAKKGTQDPAKSTSTNYVDTILGAVGLVDAESSVFYVLDNGICDTDGCAETDRTLSYEFQFEVAQAADWIAFFNDPNSEVNTHLSPERGGSLIPPPPTVPLPATLPLLAAGMFGLTALGRRRRKQS